MTDTFPSGMLPTSRSRCLAATPKSEVTRQHPKTRSSRRSYVRWEWFLAANSSWRPRFANSSRRLDRTSHDAGDMSCSDNGVEDGSLSARAANKQFHRLRNPAAFVFAMRPYFFTELSQISQDVYRTSRKHLFAFRDQTC